MTSTVTKTIAASADAVWEVLADASTYADWVVGARTVRTASTAWPAVDAVLHHSIGVGPFVTKDRTRVIDVVPGEHLALEARIRPFGTAFVDLHLHPAPDGGTLVEMRERLDRGPGALVPERLTDPLLHLRNVEALRRLERLVLDRAT